MATGAGTGAGGAGSGGPGTGGAGTASSGGDARASAWVLGQPDFSTRTMARIESSSRALVGRWAPEGGAARRSPALRSLGFADRMIAGYLGGGRRPDPAGDEDEPAAGRRARTEPDQRAANPQPDDRAGRPVGLAVPVRRRQARGPRVVPEANWLFPAPWYLDEIEWLAAARAASRESELAAARQAEATGRARTGKDRRTGGVELPLELVAPGLAPADPARVSAAALGAYSPLIDARAARTAEFLARLTPPARPVAPAPVGDERDADSNRPALSYVAPEQAEAPARSDAAGRAIELLAAGDRLVPAAGPRVVMPAGLGGVAAAAQVARAVPAARPAPHRAPTPLQPLSVATTRRPSAVDHLVWSDRWLARFSGASTSTLRSFDAARTWVAPAAPRGAGVDSGDRPAAARAVSAPAMVPAPVLDDEPVSDSVLSAIAAAAAGDRPQARRAARDRKGPPPPQAPSGPFRAPRADRRLAQVAPAGSPGLGAQLGASPAAALLAGLVEVTPQPTFDPRSLAGAPGTDLVRSAGARGPALAELASRAPGAVWLEREPQARAGADEAGKRPGDLGSGAEAFAQRRTLSASDLSLDFVSPEVLAAARGRGFGPLEAGQAQRLAAAGRPELATLASLVDRVFVAAMSPGPGSAAERGAEAQGPATAAFEKAAPRRAPRGAFLLPQASAQALGVSAAQAAEKSPGIDLALELVAAGHVAQAAAGARPARNAAGDTGPESPPPRAEDASAIEPDTARALLPAALRPVFDAVYLAMADSPETRPLAPAARAARALAVTSRTRGAGDLPLGARARAAAAWAALPVVLSGATPQSGASATTGADPATRSAAARAAHAADAAQGALSSLVAPSFLAADRAAAPAAQSPRAQAPAHTLPPAAALATPLVETGSRQPAPSAPPPAPPPPRPAAPPPSPSGSDVPAWFFDAAKKYLEGGPGSGRMSVAEMTLVTAAPAAQVAASAQSADRPVTQSMSSAHSGAAGAGSGAAGAQAPKPDIETIAQEVFDHVCRLLAIARERSGDPWQR